MPSSDVNAGIKFAVTFWCALFTAVLAFGGWLWMVTPWLLLPYGVALFGAVQAYRKHVEATTVLMVLFIFGTVFLLFGYGVLFAFGVV